MNLRKNLKGLILVSLPTFFVILLLPSIFAEKLEMPKKLSEIFLDPVFANEIAYKLGKSSTHKVVTQSELDSIEEFKRPNHKGISGKISSILGIQYLKNLKWFWAMSDNISDLRWLSDLTELSVIALPNNNIINLQPLCNLKKLTHLDLSGNKVTDLGPLSELKNLVWLEIPGNQITDFSPLAPLKNLRTLNVYDNPTTDHDPCLNILNPDETPQSILASLGVKQEQNPSYLQMTVGWFKSWFI